MHVAKLRTAWGFIKFLANFKIYERVISALKFELSG